MKRIRAADDFPAIRARMEELRREQTRAFAAAESRSSLPPRPYHVSTIMREWVLNESRRCGCPTQRHIDRFREQPK